MEMAAAETTRRRRKRPVPGDAVGAQLPAPRRRLETTEDVTDDEVKEFFAILHRMREVTRLLAPSSAVGGEAAKAESAPRWRPAFEREDFEEAGSGESASRRDWRRVASEGWERSRKAAAAAAAAEREDDDDQEDTVAENGTAGRFLDLNEEPAGDE